MCGTGQLDLIAKLSVFTGVSLDDWACFSRGCVELAILPWICGTGQLDLIAKLSVFTGVYLDDWACFSHGSVSIWMTGPASLMDLWNWPVRPHYKHLKVILVSGMNFPVEHFIKVRDQLFKGKVHVCQIYGLTETGVLTRSTPRLNKLGSVGEIVSNTKMKVVEEGTGFTLGAYQEGELCFKSQSLMLGYYKNPEATQLMFDSEGFFQTGDLGYYDSQGFVFITGRKKDIIKWRSYQISSSEVEAQLITLPEVREVVVFGIYDDKDGEHVTAAVILHPEFKDITPRELEKQANYHLSHSRKIRGGIHFFDTFPCTASGKPIKLLIAKEVLDRLHMREMECFDRCF
ncbi:hypothetical protein J6590_014659 [Homalodisca vitripennis]|nr:hypothetical protein J6590_014659 [Homalodisca vitripennis]